MLAPPFPSLLPHFQRIPLSLQMSSSPPSPPFLHSPRSPLNYEDANRPSGRAEAVNGGHFEVSPGRHYCAPSQAEVPYCTLTAC